MKAFIAVVLLAALVSAEYKVKTHKDLAQYRDECAQKHHVPADLLEKYKSWQYPDNAVTHCYMMCVLEKFGIFNKDSGFSVENVHHQIVEGAHVDHTDATHAKIEKCADKNTQGSTPCEWAYRGAMCFLSNNLPIVQHSVLPEHAEHAKHAEHEHHDHEHHHH